jgi:hypothetical protein
MTTATVEKQTSRLCEEPSYDSDRQIAIVKFKKGGTYEYPMSPGDFEAFHSAPSFGRFFHANRSLFADGKEITDSRDGQAVEPS